MTAYLIDDILFDFRAGKENRHYVNKEPEDFTSCKSSPTSFLYARSIHGGDPESKATLTGSFSSIYGATFP